VGAIAAKQAGKEVVKKGGTTFKDFLKEEVKETTKKSSKRAGKHVKRKSKKMAKSIQKDARDKVKNSNPNYNDKGSKDSIEQNVRLSKPSKPDAPMSLAEWKKRKKS
jgi:hypothetical protein